MFFLLHAMQDSDGKISPGVVTFSGLTQNNASWTWDFGDGTTGSR
ncbi:MAG: PKD domain-containing protein [Bacteroidetes bacterium]|nr:PKD domain-containing protein [Bacteroidota bacterium]